MRPDEARADAGEPTVVSSPEPSERKPGRRDRRRPRREQPEASPLAEATAPLSLRDDPIPAPFPAHDDPLEQTLVEPREPLEVTADDPQDHMRSAPLGAEVEDPEVEDAGEDEVPAWPSEDPQTTGMPPRTDRGEGHERRGRRRRRRRRGGSEFGVGEGDDPVRAGEGPAFDPRPFAPFEATAPAPLDRPSRPAEPPRDPWQARDHGRPEERRRGDFNRERNDERRPAPPPSAGPTRTPTAATLRIAVLLDAGDLVHQARGQGGEVSYSRLIRFVAGDRAVVRAIAYTQGNSTAGLAGHANLEIERCEDAIGAAVAAAVDACALADRVDCLVLVSGAKAWAPLARALRSRGVRLESASFASDGAWPTRQHHQLNKSCLFVP